MPQFDFSTFFVQIFWLSIASWFFYFIYLKYIMVNIAQRIKMRNKIISLLNSNVNINLINKNALYNLIFKYVSKNR